MDFLFYPAHRGDPPLKVPTTPYVCTERYDLGPWMNYPERKGKPITTWNGTSSRRIEDLRPERVKDKPTPSKELEPFLQVWLFFGLLAEFSGINLKVPGEDSLVTKDSQIILDHMYDVTVVQGQDGKKSVVLDWGYLNSRREMMLLRLPGDPAALREHYEHLQACLMCANSILKDVPDDFNYDIRYSICALGECLLETVKFELRRLSAPFKAGAVWRKSFLDQDSKRLMATNGWCRSDISRAEANYNSWQALHICRMLDKSLPKKDHKQCDDVSCKLDQIDTEKYVVGHQDEDCACSPITIDQGDLEKILANEDRFPLLRLTGDINDFSVTLVDSEDDALSTYVAISHVWADGLGNPRTNTLHPCKLLKLRDQVLRFSSNIEYFSSKPPTTAPLIWLDTLCCPASDGWGKQKAIEKIPIVYRRAKHVLVLDAGLMAYEAAPQDVPEQFARVFTSSWMRRLWTLQEAALANSLYFQFSDKSISILDLCNTLEMESKSSMRYRVIYLDFIKEFLGIYAYFVASDDISQVLSHLEDALGYRSASVLTDEPLCISTLLSLDLEAILAVAPKEDRMRKVWDLVALKHGGIPSKIIFFDQPRIKVPGYGWAPQSFLEMGRGIHDLHLRLARWDAPQLALITPKGLHVRYPGFIVTVIDTYEDSKPRNPLPGFQQTSESYIQFRDLKTGQWTRVVNKGTLTYDKNELFPLHHIADTGRLALIVNQEKVAIEAVFCELDSEQPNFIPSAILEQHVVTPRPPIQVKTKVCVRIQHLHPDEGHLYDTIRNLALELRGSSMTDHHLEIYDRLCQECKSSGADLKDQIAIDEEMKTSVLELEETMKVMMREVISRDERLRKAILTYYGESFLDSLWIQIHDFFNHDYVGHRLEDDQSWVVD